MFSNGDMRGPFFNKYRDPLIDQALPLENFIPVNYILKKTKGKRFFTWGSNLMVRFFSGFHARRRHGSDYTTNTVESMHGASSARKGSCDCSTSY